VNKSPFEYVVELIMSLVPLPKLPPALKAVMPILTDLLQGDAVLTDDLRAELQGRVLRALRAAGLKGEDIG
jgi:hypothetical protein